MSNKKLKKFPKFKNDDEERTFWATQDSAEYLDWSKAKKLRFTRLRPSEHLEKEISGRHLVAQQR
jgi:hypothetical protein